MSYEDYINKINMKPIAIIVAGEGTDGHATVGVTCYRDDCTFAQELNMDETIFTLIMHTTEHAVMLHGMSPLN